MKRRLPPRIAAMALGAALFLGGCVIVDADEHVRADWDGHRSYGELMGADVANNTVTARVTTNGCTTKDFIGVDVDKTGDNRFSVGFYRVLDDIDEQESLVYNPPFFLEAGISVGETFNPH